MSLLCGLPHTATGVPEKWSIGRLITFDRLSYVRIGFINESGRHLLDDLSAEATRAGVCPNHVRILRGQVALYFLNGRKTGG